MTGSTSSRRRSPDGHPCPPADRGHPRRRLPPRPGRRSGMSSPETTGAPASPIPVQSAPDRDLPYDSSAVPGPPRAHVVLLSLGGTIFMKQDETGLRAAPATSYICDPGRTLRSEEHTSELQSRGHHVCRLLLA